MREQIGAILTQRVRRTTLVFLFCLSLLLGIGLALKGHLIDSSWWWAALIALAVTLRRRTMVTVVCVILFGLSLGWWRGSLYMLKLADYTPYFDQKITIIGKAKGDAAYNQYGQLAFDATDVRVMSSGQSLAGKVAISGYGTPMVYAGDTFTAEGKLRPARGSYQGRMSYAGLEVVKVDTGLVNNLRRQFAAGMQTALPEPLSAFGMGLLIGQKANLPDATYENLKMVGLVHIIAVSGYNLTIILRATNGFLKKHSKRLSLLLALSLIGVFLLFAGSSASIVRASVVSVIAIAAAYYGRSVKPLVLIMLAAALTGMANPFYVWTDVGWYLSFLAFFGVMILAPMVLARFPARLQGSLIFTVAIESLCAEIMAMPFIIHIFGETSLIGLLANVLVVAFVPLAMLLGVFAGLAGMLVPMIAGWIAWPAKMLLTYMLDTAHILASLPHIFAEGLVLSIAELLAVYLLVGLVAFSMWRRHPIALTSSTIIDHKTSKL